MNAICCGRFQTIAAERIVDTIYLQFKRFLYINLKKYYKVKVACEMDNKFKNKKIALM